MKYLLLILALLYLTPDALAKHHAKHDRIHYFKRIPRSEYSATLKYAVPVGTFAKAYQPGTYPNPSEALFQSLNGDVGGMGAKSGYGVDFAGCYYMNNNPKPVVAGLKITYLSYSSMPFRWNTDGDNVYNNADYSNLRFYSFNIGPVVKIKIDDYASIRIYTQLCGSVAWHGAWKNSYDYAYVDAGSAQNFVHQDADLKLGMGSGIKNESGIMVSNYNFIATVGFSFGRIQFDNVQYTSTSVTDVYKNVPVEGGVTYQHVGTETQTQTLKVAPSMPTSYLFFSAGYQF